MEFKSFFDSARDKITIIGTNPLIPDLENSARFFVDLLTVRQDLRLNILYESDTENFHQSTSFSVDPNREHVSYSYLTTHRVRIAGSGSAGGLLREMESLLDETELRFKTLDRILIRQQNLRMPINVICVDSSMWTAPSTFRKLTLEDYRKLQPETPEYDDTRRYVDLCLDTSAGGLYLSKPDDELIWVYDLDGLPRGIFPRSSFYTTEFGRYVVWGFVFNNQGQILLHRRSHHTSDNRGLWDKSFGGHVGLSDASTSITAKRELIEEMYLPQAEFTRYMKADIGDIIDFGEWNPTKRPERYFKEAFQSLGPTDWTMFRATEKNGLPLTITRVSNRIIHRGDTSSTKQTVFHSDVYLLIAPRDQLDTEEQMREALRSSEESGVASDHRLVTVSELSSWIRGCEREGTEKETFTDDLLYINTSHRGLLEAFSEFVKYTYAV